MVAQRGERHPPDALRVVVRRGGRRLEREPRLAAAARARQRHEADVVPGEQLADFTQLAVAAEERRRGDRQVRAVEGLQRRELAVPQLVDPLGGGEVLEPVLAEIAHVRAGEIAGRGGEEHLAPVPGRRDARGAVDVEPDVALLRRDRLARVQTHAHPDRPVGQGVLPLACRLHGVRRARERVEEGVSLRVHLHAAVARERLAKRPAVPSEQARVAISADLVEQPRRSLHVREQERDGARRTGHVRDASGGGAAPSARAGRAR